MSNRDGAVHIVIPNYNGLRFLPACLSSIERQHYSTAQVTVVDNGSTDGSLEYLHSSYLQIRLLFLPEKRGGSAAVNAGILSSSDPYVFLLNNDSVLSPDCLDHLVAAAAELTGFDFFCT